MPGDGPSGSRASARRVTCRCQARHARCSEPGRASAFALNRTSAAPRRRLPMTVEHLSATSAGSERTAALAGDSTVSQSRGPRGAAPRETPPRSHCQTTLSKYRPPPLLWLTPASPVLVRRMTRGALAAGEGGRGAIGRAQNGQASPARQAPPAPRTGAASRRVLPGLPSEQRRAEPSQRGGRSRRGRSAAVATVQAGSLVLGGF